MATKDKDREHDDAMEHAEEIGAKTPGEARAKVASDADLAATAAMQKAAVARRGVAPFDRVLAKLGLTSHDVKSYRESAGTAVVETYAGGPPKTVALDQVYQPMIERAIERLGLDKADIKATPGLSPDAVEIPIKGVKMGDFKGYPGVTVLMDGLISIDKKTLQDEDMKALPKKKAVLPAAQDLEAAAIAKAGLRSGDVKSVKRDGEEMVVNLHDGSTKRVKVATL